MSSIAKRVATVSGIFLIIASAGTAGITAQKSMELSDQIVHLQKENADSSKKYEAQISDLKDQVKANDARLNKTAVETHKANEINSKQDKDIVELKK